MDISAVEIDQAWDTVTAFILGPTLHDTLTLTPSSDLPHHVTILNNTSMLNVLVPWFLETVTRQVSCNHAPRFHAQFSESIPQDHVMRVLSDSVVSLHDSLNRYTSCLKNLADILLMGGEIIGDVADVWMKEKCRDISLIYSSLVFYKTSQHFDEAMDSFFSLSIKSFNAVVASRRSPYETSLDADMSEDFESVTCTGCDLDSDSCRCTEVFETFTQTINLLKSFDMFQRITGEPIMRLVHARIKEQVEKKCRGNFDVRYLATLHQWLNTSLIVWLDELMCCTVKTNQSAVDPADVNSVLANQRTVSRNLNIGLTNQSTGIESTDISAANESIADMECDENVQSCKTSRVADVRNKIVQSSTQEQQQEFSDRDKENIDCVVVESLSKKSTARNSSYKDLLNYYLCETYAKVCIAQLFNIIVEYPDSQPALEDLAECMEQVDVRTHLIISLRKALESRLLHPGVNTADILTAFLAAIPALRILDSSGVLMDLVCAPVRSYLRLRTDTVRCIVTSLTEEGSGDLAEELTRGGKLTIDETGEMHDDDDDPTDQDWRTWRPDPVDADRTMVSGRQDIVNILVNVYGSRELFINEYQNILANRILSQYSYDADDKEVRYLELLKIRFGESHLHNCEVMLKDVTDSRRINSHITEELTRRHRNSTDHFSVNAMILSAQFWPQRLREEKLELPKAFNDALEEYTKVYEVLKGNRTLSWKPHLGLVSIEVELVAGRPPLEFKVTPVHAAILWHFQEKERWTTAELSEALSMPVHSLQRKLSYWQSQGLLREESQDCFVLVTDCRGGGGGVGGSSVLVMDDEEGEGAVASARDQKEEDARLVWSYVSGMLTNLDSLPLDRIHSMLKMVTMNGPGSQYNMADLKSLLDKKIREQKLTLNNGVYRLVR